jgi:hypothetical protein
VSEPRTLFHGRKGRALPLARLVSKEEEKKPSPKISGGGTSGARSGPPRNVQNSRSSAGSSQRNPGKPRNSNSSGRQPSETQQDSTSHKREIERLNLARKVKKAKSANVSATYASILKRMPPRQPQPLLTRQPPPQPQPRSSKDLELQTAFNNLSDLCKNQRLQMLKFRERFRLE